jgi:hypothetical protein
MKHINRFFWWCAGTNVDILEKCPTDQSKYFGVGGTIVFTALMASFAGGYAFFTAFKSTPLAFIFGIFWGLLIFNLDRYIVSTIGKGDGTSKITIEEWKLAAPRLIMAILLGFVIATPLELKIFEKEIKPIVERLKVEEGEKLRNADSSFNSTLEEKKAKLVILETREEELNTNKNRQSQDAGALYLDRLNELNKDSQQKDREINSIQTRINSLHEQYIQNQTNSNLSERSRNLKNEIDRLGSTRNILRNEKKLIDDQIRGLKVNQGDLVIKENDRITGVLNSLRGEISALQDEISKLEAEKIVRDKSITMKLDSYDGFGAHLEAMGTLASEKPSIFWSKWMITLLFIFIEVAPVLFKHQSKVRELQKISNTNDEINTSIKISTERNKSRFDAELKGNEELINSITMAQADIAKLAVEKWKEKEISRLDKSLSHIIKSNQKEDILFQDKFWVLTDEGSEYFFRNGKSNDLIVKKSNDFKTGNWKLNSNELEIALEGISKTYKIEKLTNDTFEIHHNESDEKLKFQIV